MAYISWTYEQARAECDYIASVDPCYPGQAFCFKPSVFASYVRMQLNHMREQNLCALTYGDLEHAEFVALHAEEYRARRGPNHDANVERSRQQNIADKAYRDTINFG